MKFEVNGNTYEFFNSWYGNRSGFVHKTRMTKNGVEVGVAKQQYYNRTWETYRFQSVMKSVVYQLQTKILKKAIENYKEKNNIKRLTREKRSEVGKIVETNEDYKELLQLYKQL